MPVAVAFRLWASILLMLFFCVCSKKNTQILGSQANCFLCFFLYIYMLWHIRSLESVYFLIMGNNTRDWEFESKNKDTGNPLDSETMDMIFLLGHQSHSILF